MSAPIAALPLDISTPDRQRWATWITNAWNAARESVFEAGRQLIAAKAGLPRGQFLAMIADDLPFGPDTAQRLMAIARDPRLANTAHARLLPTSWFTLYELTKLPDDMLAARIADGSIRPELDRHEVTQWRKAADRAQKEQDLAAATIAASADLGTKLYGVIYADPPWRFEPYNRETGMDRAADNHYPTMTIDQIKALAIPAAEDCILFLWATVPMLTQALDVMTAWGFTYKSHFVWVKDRAGTGYWNRNKHELLLVGTRGDIPAPAPGDQYESVIEASSPRHSAKPFHFREMIEEMFPTLPRRELFARGEPCDGWDQWGNEIEGATQ